MSRLQDALVILRGFQLIAKASVKLHEEHLSRLWRNSSVRLAVANHYDQAKQRADEFRANPKDEITSIIDSVTETAERVSIVAEGLRQFSVAAVTNAKKTKTAVQSNTAADSASTIDSVPSSFDVTSITLNELQEILSKRNKTAKFQVDIVEPATESVVTNVSSSLDSEAFAKDEQYVNEWMQFIAKNDRTPPTAAVPAIDIATHPLAPETIQLPTLSTVAKQRKVPSSRIGRIASFGGLFAGLGLGTVNELTKGALGLGGSTSVKEALLSPANTERIVDTLCKVRGAALKIGQILSIQDSNVVSPAIIKAFDRVRQSADYMPDWQVQKVLASELGKDWRRQLRSFDDKPFAAASIGQVHRAVMLDGTEIAIKVQYPGVAKSIESDIDNLVSMLKVWDVFPKGIFIDNIVKVAKRELAWEVDYVREAEYTEKCGEMIEKYPEYRVPKVMKELTTKSVLTTELMPGIPVDKSFDMRFGKWKQLPIKTGFLNIYFCSYEHRLFVGRAVFKLCMRELFEMRCMQTDPNWSNFLYDPQSMRLMLIDFGSSRFYSDKFIDNYSRIMECAVQDDYDGVLAHSRTMGFLTGYETKEMEAAHVNATMVLGEVFRYPGEFDFGAQACRL